MQEVATIPHAGTQPTPLMFLAWLPQTSTLLAVTTQGAAFRLHPSSGSRPQGTTAVTLSSWTCQPVWQSQDAPGTSCTAAHDCWPASVR